MAETPFKIIMICSRCEGIGEITLQGVLVDCPDCEGDGKLGEGTIEGAEQITDLTDRVDDCLDKLNNILELLNP